MRPVHANRIAPAPPHHLATTSRLVRMMATQSACSSPATHHKCQSLSSSSFSSATSPSERQSFRCGKTGASWMAPTSASSPCRPSDSATWCRRKRFTVRTSSCSHAALTWCSVWYSWPCRLVCSRRSCCGNAEEWQCDLNWRLIDGRPLATRIVATYSC